MNAECTHAGVSGEIIVLTPGLPGEDSVDRTCRLQEAIDRASANGGGQVVLRGGIFEVRTLVLRSHVRLYLEADAIVKADPDVLAYPESGEGRRHLLYAENAEGFSLEGPGTLDGNVEAVLPRNEWGGFRKVEFRLRLSPMIRFADCRRFTVRDVTIRNSQGWTLHPYRCEEVQILGVRIDNPLGIPNGDGIDLEGCRDVRVSGCHITTGDDAIIIKAGKEAQSSERIIVTDCFCATQCAGLGIGAECYWPIRDITFANCSVPRSSRIIQIELWEAGLVENVIFSNITGSTLNSFSPERPVYIDIQQWQREDGALGAVRNIVIQNLVAHTRGRILMTAQDGAKIEKVTLTDIHLTLPEIEDPVASVEASRSNQLSNYSPESRIACALMVLDNCHGVVVRNLQATWPAQDHPVAARRAESGYAALRESVTRTGAKNAVRSDLPMHALFIRNSSRIQLDAPFLQPNGSVHRIARSNNSQSSSDFVQEQAGFGSLTNEG